MAAKQKSGLGRGLGALFDDYSIDEMENNTKTSKKGKTSTAPSTSEEEGEAVVWIDINDIKPNENQPRKHFDAEKISDLAASIKEHGIIENLVLRKSEGGYSIVAGERRWRAAREAGLKKVPAVVRELTDQENMLIALIENMQREDLNPIEEAEGLSAMMETYGLTQEQISKSVGKSRPYISNALRLLVLPKEIREMLSVGEITAGHAKALLSIPGENMQLDIARRIGKEGLSVRDVERLSRDRAEKTGTTRGKKRQKNSDVLAVEEELKEILGTKVAINNKGKKGAIEIEYYSIEELNRLIDILKTVKG